MWSAVTPKMARNRSSVVRDIVEGSTCHDPSSADSSTSRRCSSLSANCRAIASARSRLACLPSKVVHCPRQFLLAKDDLGLDAIEAALKLLGVPRPLAVEQFEADELGHVLHAVDDVLDLPAPPEHGRVDRTPIPLLKAAFGAADVVLLNRHCVRLAVSEDMLKGLAQVVDARRVRVGRVVGECLKDRATNTRLARGHRGAEVGVVHGDDGEPVVRPEDEVRGRGGVEDRSEVELLGVIKVSRHCGG